jgi:hypothetical protein
MAHDVFICHSSKDRTIANAVCSTLEQNRIRCWIAPRDVLPGSEYAESIVEAIHTSKLTILVFSANSNQSAHVRKEIERSVNAGIPILPFRVEDVAPSPSLEYFISDAHWLDALTPPLEEHLEYLVGTVRLLLDRQSARDENSPTDADHVAAPGPTTDAANAATGIRRTLVWVGLAAMFVVAALVIGLFAFRGSGGDEAGPGSAPTASAGPKKTFTDEFSKSVDPSWTWESEDPAAWRVSADGWLQIDAQQGPPFRNLLLRTAPSGSYSVKVRLRFPASASGFAGLVFTGDNPDTRLQFGWTQKGLSATDYKDGNIVADSIMKTADLPVSKNRDALLVLEVKDGLYRTRYYNPGEDSYWDMGTARLDPAYTRVGLLVYSKNGATITAGFDSFAIF